MDLFGGARSQIPSAINFDIIAEEGIKANVYQLTDIFPESSVDEIIASSPQAEFLPQAAKIIKPLGRIYINANFKNRYRYGTNRGKRAPNEDVLFELKLNLIQDGNFLNSRFSNLVFRRTDGIEIPKIAVRTVIYEKLK